MNMTKGRARAMAGGLACTVVLAGCGGSSGSGSSGLSKQDLATKTQSICAASATKIKAIATPSDFATNPAAAAAYLDKISAVYHDARSQLGALKPASDVKSQWSAVTTQLGALVTLVDDIAQKAHAKDRSGVAELQKVGPLTASLNAATKAIGANCASA